MLENTSKILTGQGQYIAFHKLPNGGKKELSRECFEQIYKIFNQYDPAAALSSSADLSNRYQLIKSKVKEIDPTLEIAFVPRTLYELIFIRKCVKEDLKYKEVCPFLDTRVHRNAAKYLADPQNYEPLLKENPDLELRRKCWHLCRFIDAGNNDHLGVKDVAYRLNQSLVKKLSPKAEGFTFQKLSKYTEQEIDFLKEQYNKDSENDVVGNCVTPGPATNFFTESTRGSIKPMGIRDDKDAQIIRNAIALECSKIAEKSLILYRGSDFQKECPYNWEDINKPYSLSYGTSLFAGCLHDGGATAFHYMRKPINAYAIPIPFDQLDQSFFYIPPTNVLAQLFGTGEIFHARTKAWKDFDVKGIGGMNIRENGHIRDHLKSNLTRDELVSQFNQYKGQAIQLK